MKRKDSPLQSQLSKMEKLRLMIEIIKDEPKMWVSPEVAIYIDEYAKAHPEKKMTKHLMRKLEREYWRSVRAEAKKQKKP